MPDQALDAFRRLLREAATGGQAKVDALLALAQRTVFVATHTPDGDDLRTLVNGNEDTALPVFTRLDELERAAAHFGWQGDGAGTPPTRELGARQALRYVIAHDLDFAVVDIAAPWRLEVERSEIEPLVSGNAEPGPFGGVGKLSSSVMRAVNAVPPPSPGGRRSSTPPPSLPASAPPAADPDGRASAPPPSSAPPPRRTPSRPSSRPPSAAGVPSLLPDGRTLGAPDAPPSDDFLDAAFLVLKDYPEVEWASWCAARNADTGATCPAVAMRVDAGYRMRVDEIVGAVADAGTKAGHDRVEVLLLDDPELLRTAKTDGVAFYPWRPR